LRVSSHDGDVRVRGKKRLGRKVERGGRVLRGVSDGLSVAMREAKGMRQEKKGDRSQRGRALWEWV